MKRGIVERYVLTLVLLLASACDHSGKGSAMSHSDAEGLWQQAREVPAPNAQGNLPDTYTFRYEQGLVTMRLLVVSKASWRSDDGFYTLKSRWDGNTLYYLAPIGEWSELATLDGGKFVLYGEGKKREYERIQPDQVADFSKPILAPDRAPFDYDRAK
jgi:hypothetical protein